MDMATKEMTTMRNSGTVRPRIIVSRTSSTYGGYVVGVDVASVAAFFTEPV